MSEPDTVLCTRCRHPFPLHGNGTTPCRARNCHGGPDASPCPGFLGSPASPDALPSPGRAVPVLAFRAPA
jgi:hypothetical protein